MNSISIAFSNPWLLLLVIPAIALAFRPFLKIPNKNRQMKKMIISLGLHILNLIVIILIVAGISLQQEELDTRDNVIILVDRSSSITMNEDRLQERIEEILNEAPSDYKVGIIEFGNDSIYSVKMSADKEQVLNDYNNSSFEGDHSATNIEQALQYAFDQFSNPNKGRIILLSDGRETDGNGLSKSRILSNLGVRIDVFYIPPINMERDALVESIYLPNQTVIGLESQIEVSLNSNLQTQATLELTVVDENNQETVYSKEVNVTYGVQKVMFQHTFESSGVKELKATLNTIETDILEENNTMYQYVDIYGTQDSKLLIIESNFGEMFALENLLKDYSYEVETINIDDLPLSIEELTMYSAVILSNVKNEDLLENNFVQTLDDYVRKYGGGLLTIGGDRAYQKRDMAAEGVNPLFNNLLPVDSSTDPKAMAVVIVMDASSSMSNNTNRFEIAKEGAIESLNELYNNGGDAGHQFGVVTFDANLKDVIPMQSVDNINFIEYEIDQLQTGFGTRYVNGLQKAKDMLSAPALVNTEKHIIFLTDGGPQDTESQYMSVLNSLDGISVSTIAVGRDGENNLDPAVVESMVVEYNNRGAFYRVQNQSDLYDVMVEDTAQAQSGDFAIEEPFQGIINTITPEFASINELPVINGYYATRAKVEANVIIQTHLGDPLFAVWTPEELSGTVASFTTELSGDVGSFSELLMTDITGREFAVGMVQTVLPNNFSLDQTMNFEFLDGNYKETFRIRVDTLGKDTIRASVKTPSGDTKRVPLTSVSDSTFTGSFDRDEIGIYTITIDRYNSKGKLISQTSNYSVFSYSQEYKKEYDEENAIVIMEEIIAKGQFLHSADDMFSAEAETIITEVDIRTLLAWFSIILFLSDIVIRKFKFSWSHQYFGKN